MITTTLFRIPMCRELGTESFHEDDYYVSCQSSSFHTATVLGVVGVLAIPVGVPLVFYLRMRAKVQELGGLANENEAGGAKLVADDVDDGADHYAFLVSDYKPQAWYWETVSYSRKLCLNGWTVIVGRGTMGQVFFATLTSAAFLIWHMRVFPFVVRKHNIMEAIGEATLLLMYTTVLLLRNDSDDDWSAEWVSKAGYGWMLAVLYVVICPSPLFYSLWLRLSGNGAVDEADNEGAGVFASEEYENPLGPGPDEVSAAVGVLPAALSAEQRARRAKVQQRKSKSLASDLAKAQAEISKQAAEIKSLIKERGGGGETLSTDGSVVVDALTVELESIQKFVEDDSLSEEVRAAARETREGRVSARVQLLQHDAKKQALVLEQNDFVLQQDGLQLAARRRDLTYRGASDGLETALSASTALRAWLGEHRLLHHEAVILAVVGPYCALPDLENLDEPDVAAATANMTRSEARRFSAAVAALAATRDE
jgi:hypothetical protein